jgi:hypothetical protein
MNLLKTPHQLLLEEAGAIPASPGLLHTPKQMLMQEAGVTPRFADGGQVLKTPEDMIAEMIAANQEPQRFAQGGSAEAMSPELARALSLIYEQQMNSGELPPEPTFQAQPKTLTSRTRDQFAKFLGEKPADRLFGTGSEGQQSEYLPLQILNPVSATTEAIDAVPEMMRQFRQGDTLGASLTAGVTGLSALPFVKPAKNIIKKIKNK